MNDMTKGAEKMLEKAEVRDLLESKSSDIMRFIQSIVRSQADAEDLFQSGSIRALENSNEIKDVEKTYSWMLSIFRNLALDFLRLRKKNDQRFSSIESESVENLSGASAESETVACGCGENLLSELPKQYSALIKNVEIDGKTVKQVAKELATSPGNVSVRLHRARASLRHAVQQHCQVETLAECLDCDCAE